MNKQVQQEIKKELQECFKIFYFSICQHKTTEHFKEDMHIFNQDISELMEISEDVDLKVKFVCKLTNGEVKHTKYQPIQLYIKNGVDINGDVETIYAQVKAVIRKDKHLLESAPEKPFFKSEEFVIRENAKSKEAKERLAAIKREESAGIIIDLQQLQERSGNKIRFDANQILEV